MSDAENDLIEIMREAIRRIELYTSTFTLDGFLDDLRTIDAVALNLLVIGECANRMSPAIKLRSTLPWTKMVALRHRIAHGYTSVDPRVLWRVAKDNLPELARELDALEAR